MRRKIGRRIYTRYFNYYFDRPHLIEKQES